jgi:hypothetical protein
VRIPLDDAPFDPTALHWTRHPDAPAREQLTPSSMDASDGPAGLPRRAAVAPAPHGTSLPEALLGAGARTGGEGSAPMPAARAGPTLEVGVRATRWKGNHERYLEHTPFWGKFRVDPSMVQAHLARTVPMEGLSDVGVQRPSKPEFVVRERKVESEREAGLMELWEARGKGS